jgi:hypothetical protein
MIHLVPSAGLSNRIRSVNAGIQLANHLNLPITIVWTQDALLNCSFQELFQKPKGIIVLEEPIQYKLRYFPASLMRFPWSIITRVTQRLAFERCLFIHDLNPTWNRMFSEQWLLKKVDGVRSILLQSDYNFFGEAVNFLTPTEEIESKVKNLCKDITENTVGVHIRRTDHEPAKAQSTDEFFMKAMDACIRENNEVQFYLASDSEIVKEKFQKVYRDRLMTFSVDNRRDSPSGIKDAYVEALCLSKTSKIIGSYQSSFSALASQLGGKQLIVVGQ